MKNFILDMILLSDKRQKVILLLLEGPMTIDTIKKILNASATSIQPQIKMLKEHSLVAQEKNIYKLSEIGKIVAVKLKPLINTLSFLEENVNYWFERDLTEIPTYLLTRINELGHLTITEPQPDNMFELNAEYIKNAKKAKKLEATISYFHPLFPSLYLEVAEKGTFVSLILQKSILKKWTADHKKQTEKFIAMENTKFFVGTDYEKVPAITAADNFMAMVLFPKNVAFDRKYIFSFEQDALAWGKELYDHYEQLSARIYNIENAEDKIN
jgi:predicted transcriptional regulator